MNIFMSKLNLHVEAFLRARRGKSFPMEAQGFKLGPSLVPRPFCGGGKNSLVYTVDACALTSVKCP